MLHRNPLISFLQIFGILLVVLGHSFVWGVQNNLLRNWIYSFHMPLFFFISGYLFKNCKLSGLDGFFAKKTRRLLYPYIIISSIVYFSGFSLRKSVIHLGSSPVSKWGHMLAYPFQNVVLPFWFLPTLFIVMIVFMLGLRVYQRWHHYFIGGVGSMMLLLFVFHLFNPVKDVSFLNLGWVLHYIFYFILGVGYHHAQEKIDRKLYLHNNIAVLITFAFSMALLPFDLLGLDVLKAVNGIVFSIALGYRYIRCNYSFFHHLEGKSFAIYLFSWFPQVVIQEQLSLNHMHWLWASLIAIVAGVYLPVIIYYFAQWLNKHYQYSRYVTMLIGL